MNFDMVLAVIVGLFLLCNAVGPVLFILWVWYSRHPAGEEDPEHLGESHEADIDRVTR